MPAPATSSPGTRGGTRWRRALAAALVLAAGGCASTRAAENDRIAELLRLEAGMTVADVGAGGGASAVAMAERVGAAGRVFATEVEPEEIERLERRVESEGVDNMTVVLGTDEATGLEAECCDAILLRLVYHHFTRPAAMRASLAAALKPGGRIAVIDIRPQPDWRELEGVPDRGGHGILPDDLVAEMTADGFEVVERIDEWPGDDDYFCVVFRRPLRSALASHQATP